VRSRRRWRKAVGRIRARCQMVRLPNPPVRTVRATFTAHGSRDRDCMVTAISSGFHRVHGVQLTRSLSSLYRFPPLSLWAFALYVAFPHADYSAQSDCLQGLGHFGTSLPSLLPLSFSSLSGSPGFALKDSNKMMEVACCLLSRPLFAASQS
jgi:hypothetical protein